MLRQEKNDISYFDNNAVRCNGANLMRLKLIDSIYY